MTRLALLALLGACFTSTDPADVEHELRCTVFASCGDTAPGATIVLDGTVEQLTDETNAWVEACALITNYRVADGECPYVWCGAVCKEVTP